MPIKEFRKDLEDAAAPDRYPHLGRIRAGDSDGSISFIFTHPASDERIQLEAIVSDGHDYPKSHTFFIFSASDEVSTEVIEALERAQSRFEGMTIHKLLTTVDRVVSDALYVSSPQCAGTNDPDSESSSDGQMFDEEDDSDLELDRDRFFPISGSPNLRKKIRRDLRAVKAAGFKVGYLGATTGMIIISVACRIARLGLSDEAMQAWGVRPADYLVLLIRHRSAYQGLQEVLALGDAAPELMQLCVGLCDSYKPSLDAAVYAFQGASPPNKDTRGPRDGAFQNSMREFFIGEPLNKLLKERFLGIVNLRLLNHFSWTGAEYCFHDAQGKITGGREAASSQYKMGDSWRTPATPLLVPDHLVDANFTVSEISLPLLAMQFTLRHFVKCTEFCLVCHCKTTDDFEALKPYVCSNGLCLYQYITLRMGPSLEYEIRSQPYVVDMLICLAYIRAQSRALNDFPTGLGLRVPDISSVQQDNLANLLKDQPASKSSKGVLSINERDSCLLLYPNGNRLMVGDWIVIMEADLANAKGRGQQWHCRVEKLSETSGHATISLPVRGPYQLSPTEVFGGFSYPKEVRYLVYDNNFDEIDIPRKLDAMIALLDILPSVAEMIKYLGHHSSGRLLSSWRDRMSPAALDLLRWIVSSNRSCILQDNNNQEHLVTGMDAYIQFRLVQGAPDKEQRFVQAVKAHAEREKSSYPTIFAWHGSGLQNWHSILREGLHYDQIVHGRSYGDGVYLSNHFNVSAGYVGTNIPMKGRKNWPQSKLNMLSMVSLNEVVNCTSQFHRIQPHYVMTQLDWIQARYLFVGTSDASLLKKPNSTVYYQQDPNHLAFGPDGQAIKIPLSAISSSRRREIALSLSGNKSSQIADADELEGFHDLASVSTEVEDLNILLSDSDSEEDSADFSTSKRRCTERAHGRNTEHEVPPTDFTPGTLKRESLPLLAQPVYATNAATKLLQRHLQSTLKVQDKEKLHELGWYIDPNLIENMYQWIVELHSFDPALPLAKDLKSANMHSVILEIRFPSQFPMDPPFVRVIRPRFLGFMNGGGGHVTAGGAMCMELLTNSGWSAVASIESVLLQVRMAITSTDPRPARLAIGGQSRDYAVGEAIQAYKRACMQHDWKVPKEMDAMFW
ncbi:hypothetical protein N7492_007709 [Penicillium capsulatum]|uniref:UBC core domain-containing protein n=1 Tax=Penicillium capsulatum TaxID=69766 RepID=A0A9W9LL41_9EURO|nr:hypothetical protein N7492_007709 [Penicillium capsulatum]KAJ6117541.1 hypothetical protein N7512_007266 [Penicillium capsulatum]